MYDTVFPFFVNLVDSSETPTPTPTTDTSSTPASQAQEAPTEVRTRQKYDPAWGYCTQITEGGRAKIKCMNL